MQDFYEVLNVSRDASQDEIKRAYMRMVREHPPHRAPDRFKQIQTAYETLGKPELRGSYTELLLHGGEISRLMETAGQAIEREDWTEALKSFDRLGRIHPSSAEVFCHKGICHFKLDQTAKGHEAFRECLELSDDSIEYCLQYAGAMIDCAMRIESEDEQRAGRLLSQARTLLIGMNQDDPEDADVLMFLARCDLFAMRFDDAEAWIRKSILADNRVDAHDIERFVLLVNILVQAGKSNRVQSEIRELRNGIGSDSDLCHYAASRMINMASIAMKKKLFIIAASYSEAAMVLWPDNNEFKDFDEFTSRAKRVQELFDRFTADQTIINPIKRAVLVYVGQLLDIDFGFRGSVESEIRGALNELGEYPVLVVKETLASLKRRYRVLHDLNPGLFDDLTGYCDRQIQASSRPRSLLDEATDFLRKIFS